MKNLKRILSLALAGTMLVGMMVVGASATDFVDAEDIKHPLAVNTLNALGIINGFEQPDGTYEFDPAGGLNRSQMATMLATLLNKGTPWTVKPDSIKFTDAKGHWAEASIAYCANLGVVNGYSDTVFGVADQLTGTQAARMILNAMGFKWDGTGDWQLATEVKARELGLYGSLGSILPGETISRDDVAQMLYNALTVKMEETYIGDVSSPATYYKIETTDDVTAQETIEALTFSSAAEALVVAQSYGLSAGATTNGYVIVSESKNITVQGPIQETLAHKYLSLTTKVGTLNSVRLVTDKTSDYYGMYQVVTSNATVYTKEDTCSDLIGQNVRVLYKNAANVYGIMASGAPFYEGSVSGLVSYATNNLSATNAALLMGATTYEWNNGTTSSWTGKDAAFDVKAVQIDTTDDGDPVYRVTVMPFELGEVLNVGKSTLQVKLADGTSDIQELTKVVTYDGIAKGDYVKITRKANTVATTKDVFEEITPAPLGKIDASRSGKYRINGEWYSVASPMLGIAYTAKLGDDIINAIVINNVIFLAETEIKSTGAVNYALLIAANEAIDNKVNPTPAQARLLFADGTIEVVEITKANGTAFKTENDVLVTYTEKNGVYTLKKASTNTGDDMGFDQRVTIAAPATSYDYAKGGKSTVENLPIAADAVVFVKNGTKYTVITGAVLAALNDASTYDFDTDGKVITGTNPNVTVNEAYADEDAVTGFYSVSLAFIDSYLQRDTSVSGTDKYGIVMSSLLTVLNDDDETVYALTIWDGEDYVDVLTADQDYAPGMLDVIRYEIDGNTIDISDVYDFSPYNAGTTQYVGAVSAWSAARGEMKVAKVQPGDDFAISTAADELILVDKDTVILGLNADYEGVESPILDRSLALDDTGMLPINVLVVHDGGTPNPTAQVILVMDNMFDHAAKGSIATPSAKKVELKDGAKQAAEDVLPVGASFMFDNNTSFNNVDFDGTEVDGWGLGTLAKDFIFFSYELPELDADISITLTIKNLKTGAKVYEENSAADKNEGLHFASMYPAGGLGYNAGQNPWSVGGVSNLTAGTAYYWTITGSDNVLYASGTFTAK